ncbi:hypothetical protein M758_1G214500 [Ceratodon purpureus]|nr:hypothetical protein M758_1G214500 [Ceratodon purpureus]
MDRQISHRHASSSSSGIHALAMKKPPKFLAHPLPNSTCLQRDLMSMSWTDLLKVAKQLKHTGAITTLRLFVSLNEQHIVNQRFSSLDRRTTDAVFEFTRALSRAIEGWMHDVEIGLSLWNRDLEVLSEAFGFSKTLRRLSFANSGLGDVRLEILAGGLRDCMPLQTLDLSGCALTDASVRCITVIVKSAVTRKAELEWKASLRESMSRRSGQDNYPANKIPIGNLALAALDLSYNAFTDLLPRDLCVALRMGAPLYALNLRFNQVTRVGAKFLLDVMHEFNILRLVDLRGNEDEKLLGVLENGEHYTQFSTFQVNLLDLAYNFPSASEIAPFWLESPSAKTNYSNSEMHEKKKKRDSENVRSKHPDQQTMRPFQKGRCNLAPQFTTTTRDDHSISPTSTHLFKIQSHSPLPEDLLPKFPASEGATIPISLEPTQESDEGGTNNILRIQRSSKKGRPQTAPERRMIMPPLFRPEQKGSCDQENSRPNTANNASCRAASFHVPSWDRDWVCKHLTPPGMIDPPRETVSAEPPKMFTNELYEVEEESTPTNSVCLTNMSSMKKEKGLGQIINLCSHRSTPRRSSEERANNKRKIPDSQRRRSRRPSRTSRKSPPPNQIARARYLTWDVRNQKKTKLPSLQSVSEEQSSALMSSEDIKKEVEWHKFVTEMTETLLTLRGVHNVALR